MMACVSMAARESVRCSVVSLLKSHARAPAVREVHFPLIRTRLTPREAYCCCSSSSEPCTSIPSGICAASVFSSRGSAEANNIASRMRSSSTLTSCIGAVSWGLVTIFKLRIAVSSPFGFFLLPACSACWRHAPSAPSAFPITGLLVPAYIQGRKSRLLLHLHHTLANQLKGRSKTRCEYRTSEAGIDDERKQILIEPRPVSRPPDQTLERFACLRQRPDASLGHPYMRKRAALALLRVSGQEIVQGRRPFRMLDVRDGLRLTSTKNIPIELGTTKQLLGDGADGFQALEPQRKRAGECSSVLAFLRRDIGQQEPRLQIGKPRSHQKVVGRKLQPEPAGLLDEGQILVCKREDGDLGEIYLLLAGQRQQKVKRPLESFDVNYKRRLVGGSFVRKAPVGGLSVP